jgi:hypothetical protein
MKTGREREIEKKVETNDEEGREGSKKEDSERNKYKR